MTAAIVHGALVLGLIVAWIVLRRRSRRRERARETADPLDVLAPFEAVRVKQRSALGAIVEYRGAPEPCPVEGCEGHPAEIVTIRPRRSWNPWRWFRGWLDDRRARRYAFRSGGPDRCLVGLVPADASNFRVGMHVESDDGPMSIEDAARAFRHEDADLAPGTGQ